MIQNGRLRPVAWYRYIGWSSAEIRYLRRVRNARDATRLVEIVLSRMPQGTSFVCCSIGGFIPGERVKDRLLLGPAIYKLVNAGYPVFDHRPIKEILDRLEREGRSIGERTRFLTQIYGVILRSPKITTVWVLSKDHETIEVINQRSIVSSRTDMTVRGSPFSFLESCPMQWATARIRSLRAKIKARFGRFTT